MKVIVSVLTAAVILALSAVTVWAEDDEVSLTPKVLVESYECISLEEDRGDGVINAGDRVEVRVTLLNTSWTEAVMNMTVTASAGENFILRSPSDCQYLRFIYAGDRAEVVYEYEIKAETPAGQYEITLSYDYAYGTGMSYSGSGSARVNVAQPLEMEFFLAQVPGEAVISDRISVDVQAINLSRTTAYNVRAEIEADGFAPFGTAFIGDMEGGTAMTGSAEVAVVSLTESTFPYGRTKGTVTFYYEDEEGNEFSAVKEFSTEICSPFSDAAVEVEDEPGQWWIIMGVIGGVILIFAVLFTVRRMRGRGKDEAVG